MDSKIAISGELGSGKTVLSNKLASVLDMEIISVGKIQRQLAEKYGMNALEFNKYMETHPELDEECDRMVAMYGKEDRALILDSRMAWHFVPDSFKVHLLANSYIAAKRIFNDHIRKNEAYSHIEEARIKLVERKKSETLRFKQQYGVDIDNFDNYDLVIDTSCSLPEIVFDKVMECFALWKRKERFDHLLFSPPSLLPVQTIRGYTSTENASETYPILVMKGVPNAYFVYDGQRQTDVSLLAPAEFISCEMYR
ncbi:MAG: cytidylate kinase family protein [Tannerellaceae bacterium]|jgi:cytidylate kinase|nr:cytidylate kinase family protein [Tannerellaceae bacterium]